jgi:hypothetical protein
MSPVEEILWSLIDFHQYVRSDGFGAEERVGRGCSSPPAMVIVLAKEATGACL